VAAFESKGFRIEPQFALLLLFAVALDAVLLQQRADFVVEICREDACGNQKERDEVFHQEGLVASKEARV
jgi:hypothetical protein